MTTDTTTPLPRSAERAAPSGGWSSGDLADNLRDLDLAPGDVILVHCSMKSLGLVDGGEQAVVAALRDVIGEEGTIVVPSGTADNCHPSRWKLTIGRETGRRSWRGIVAAMTTSPYDPAVTPSVNMGRVAEAVRRAPGALRSDHPQTSFAALGPAAAKITGGHRVECHLGEDSPLARLVELQAKILLLGVGYAVCSAFHLAEYRVRNPPRRGYECVVRTPEGGKWYQYRDVALDDRRFGALGRALEARHKASVNIGQVGSAVSRLLPMPEAVDFAVEWLGENRLKRRRSPAVLLDRLRRARRDRRVDRSIRTLK